MNTLVVYGNRKKLQLLIFLKGKVAKVTFLTKKFITKSKKDYKKLEKSILLEMPGCSLNTLNTLRIRHG